MKTLLLTMPTYDKKCKVRSAMALFCSNAKDFHIERSSFNSSVIPIGFNTLWDFGIKGKYDYFAMIHSDIEPEEGWLEKMLNEMNENNLDVISAVIAIKNEQGMSSIAVNTTDKWHYRNISIEEAKKLSKTFTEFEGKSLLINTGLMICKMGDWAKDVIFRFQSNKVNGEYVTIDEGYDFSHQLHDKGLRVGATTVVKIIHDGWKNY
ncbi:MAG TPA: glycosyltransferase [Spirochaetia bacterium]|nr:glycosyltransferase [Spirochaetia bacterium]